VIWPLPLVAARNELYVDRFENTPRHSAPVLKGRGAGRGHRDRAGAGSADGCLAGELPGSTRRYAMGDELAGQHDGHSLEMAGAGRLGDFRLERLPCELEDELEMTWNPSVRSTPIIVAARPSAPGDERMREMEEAALTAVAMELARRASLRNAASNGVADGHASAWVVKGRMDTANRWFV
jgi:hypothetical protein